MSYFALFVFLVIVLMFGLYFFSVFFFGLRLDVSLAAWVAAVVVPVVVSVGVVVRVRIVVRVVVGSGVLYSNSRVYYNCCGVLDLCGMDNWVDHSRVLVLVWVVVRVAGVLIGILSIMPGVSGMSISRVIHVMELI